MNAYSNIPKHEISFFFTLVFAPANAIFK